MTNLGDDLDLAGLVVLPDRQHVLVYLLGRVEVRRNGVLELSKMREKT